MNRRHDTGQPASCDSNCRHASSVKSSCLSGKSTKAFLECSKLKRQEDCKSGFRNNNKTAFQEVGQPNDKTVPTPISFHFQIMFHITFPRFPSNLVVGGVSVFSNLPEGINDRVLSKIRHMEQREWLPKPTYRSSVTNLSCCYWLIPLMMPEELHQPQQQGDCRCGLEGRLCGVGHSLQVHSMGINKYKPQ